MVLFSFTFWIRASRITTLVTCPIAIPTFGKFAATLRVASFVISLFVKIPIALVIFLAALGVGFGMGFFAMMTRNLPFVFKLRHVAG